MKFKGIIRNVGEAVTGTSKTTGREWQKRELVIAIPFTTESGKSYENLMVGSYFGEATKESLLALADTAAPLEFTVYFDVHKHEQRYYQDIRIGDIKTIVQ